MTFPCFIPSPNKSHARFNDLSLPYVPSVIITPYILRPVAIKEKYGGALHGIFKVGGGVM